MVEYGSFWGMNFGTCEYCGQKRPLFSVQTPSMSKIGMSLQLCSSCFRKISTKKPPIYKKQPQ